MQLDVKRPLPVENLLGALDLAKEGRRAILNAMEKECKNTLPGLHPRASMKSTAPRVEVIKFDPNRKRDLIGPGGAVLRQLEDRFNISLDLSQEGRCLIFGSLSSVSKAKNVIMDLVSDVEEGGVYEGTVIEIKDFGAVVELLRNKEGLLHVSEITDSADRHPGGNIGLVKEHLTVGDKIEVLCTKIDHVQGSIRLSRKKLLRMRRNTFSHSTPNNVHSIEPVSGVSLPINSVSSKDSYVQTMEERVSTDKGRLGKDGKETQEIKMGDGYLGDEVQEDGIEDELEEIAQWISTSGEESDDDDDTDDDGIGLDTDMVDDEKSVDEAVSKSLKIMAHSAALDARWMERYNELKQYKSANGDCNVSSKSSKHPQLGMWVTRQRSRYKKGRISDDRLQRLDDIEFSWAPLDQHEVLWEQRFNELEQFESANGHCNIPGRSSEHPKLANWVKGQRSQYKKGRISDDRVQRLDDIGFAWSCA